MSSKFGKMNTYRVSSTDGRKGPQVMTVESPQIAAEKFAGGKCWFHSGQIDKGGEWWVPEDGSMVLVELVD